REREKETRKNGKRERWREREMDGERGRERDGGREMERNRDGGREMEVERWRERGSPGQEEDEGAGAPESCWSPSVFLLLRYPGSLSILVSQIGRASWRDRVEISG